MIYVLLIVIAVAVLVMVSRQGRAMRPRLADADPRRAKVAFVVMVAILALVWLHQHATP
jgi:hypothetical protein